MTVLCIPDLHAPYHHPTALDFLADVARRCKPTTVICPGDEVNAYCSCLTNPDAGAFAYARQPGAAADPWL